MYHLNKKLNNNHHKKYFNKLCINYSQPQNKINNYYHIKSINCFLNNIQVSMINNLYYQVHYMNHTSIHKLNKFKYRLWSVDNNQSYKHLHIHFLINTKKNYHKLYNCLLNKCNFHNYYYITNKFNHLSKIHYCNLYNLYLMLCRFYNLSYIKYIIASHQYYLYNIQQGINLNKYY